MENRKLHNGCEIPVMGYGTGIAPTWREASGFFAQKGAQLLQYAALAKHKNLHKIINDLHLVRAMKACVAAGGTLFDTSRAYGGSENALGEIIKTFGRDKIFVCTKMKNYDQRTSTARKAIETSLKCLGTDSIDLYLLHWPQTNTWQDAWKQLEQLYDEGICKAIGVSNFNTHHLEELSTFGNICPMVNQFECHPLFTQVELREYCQNHGIQVMAYSPTATMDFRLKNSAILERIALKHCKTPVQVILRWHIEIGNIPIMHSTKLKHIRQNLDIFDFKLTQYEIDSISGININARTRYDPDNCDFLRL